MRHFPFAKKRQACFDFFYFFAVGASAAAGAGAAGAAAVASSERFKMRTVGVALLLRAAARAAAQALVAAMMSNARDSCASITASEGMVDGEPCDCCFCLARRDLPLFSLSAGAMLDALSLLASPAVLALPVRTPGGSASWALREQFCKKSSRAHLVPRNAVPHSHQSFDEETRTQTIGAAAEVGSRGDEKHA